MKSRGEETDFALKVLAEIREFRIRLTPVQIIGILTTLVYQLMIEMANSARGDQDEPDSNLYLN